MGKSRKLIKVAVLATAMFAGGALTMSQGAMAFGGHGGGGGGGHFGGFGGGGFHHGGGFRGGGYGGYGDWGYAGFYPYYGYDYGDYYGDDSQCYLQRRLVRTVSGWRRRLVNVCD